MAVRLNSMRIYPPVYPDFSAWIMVGQYRVAVVAGDPGHVWVFNGEGEGLQTQLPKLEASIAAFFNKEF